MPAKEAVKAASPAKPAAAAAPAKEAAKPAAAPAPAKEVAKPAAAAAPAAKPAAPAAKPAAAVAKPAAAKAKAPKKVGTPETVLKRRAKKLSPEIKLKKRVALKKKNSGKRNEIFKRAERYLKDYRAQERTLINFRRQARNNGSFFIEPEAKLAFVVRVRGIMNMHPKPRKILQILRLRQVNNGIFIKLNKATLQMLKLVEPYVTWGSPNLKSVRELIYKRGFLKMNQQRIAITDNKLVEARLSHHGCVCVEDIIHEIFTVGPKFSLINRALWAFQLNPPKGGYRRINKAYSDGGDFGNREDKINELIRQMN